MMSQVESREDMRTQYEPTSELLIQLLRGKISELRQSITVEINTMVPDFGYQKIAKNRCLDGKG